VRYLTAAVFGDRSSNNEGRGGKSVHKIAEKVRRRPVIISHYHIADVGKSDFNQLPVQQISDVTVLLTLERMHRDPSNGMISTPATGRGAITFGTAKETLYIRLYSPSW